MPKRDEAYMAARRNDILDAATACLLRSGVSGTSTTAICAEAGISMGALYTHFRSKNDILLALAQRTGAERRNVLVSESAGEFQAALAQLVDDDEARGSSAVARIDLQLLSLKGEDPAFAPIIAAIRDNNDFIEALAHLAELDKLEPGVDPAAAATALEAMLMGFKVLTLMGRKQPDAYLSAIELVTSRLMKPDAVQPD